MKHTKTLSIRFAILFVFASLTNSANAGWFDNLIKPVAYEEIPVPEVLNAPVQNESSILLHDSTAEAYPAVPSEQYVPQPYHDAPMHGQVYESYSPIVQAAPMHHHRHAVCCKQPRVTYRNHPILAMLMHKCKTGHAHQVVLEVPTGCCPAEVTVCAPLCCNTVPSMTKHCDLLGRCVFEYCWPCGTKIKIVKRHNGDLVVHSYEL